MSALIYVIAGEASGDFLGSQLMASIRHKQADIRFAGIGGELMEAEGLKSAFPMQELSLMGLVEILPHIRRLKQRMRQTVEHIIALQPDMIVTIDSPGFTYRVIRQLRNNGFTKPCIHYVAPTVWAYKPKRAAKTAALFDHLLCLLPFEPPYFEKEGLKTDFIGHAVAWQWQEQLKALAAPTTQNPPLVIMPGSRYGEWKRLLPMLRIVCEHLSQTMPELKVVVPVRHRMAYDLNRLMQDWPCPVHFAVGEAEKYPAMAGARLIIAKSGTGALEASLAQVPTLVLFRAHPISAFIFRLWVKIPYGHLLNIMAWRNNQPAPIPELIQERCTPENLLTEVKQLLAEDASIQINATAPYRKQLLTDTAISPSDKAAAIILSQLAESAGSPHSEIV